MATQDDPQVVLNAANAANAPYNAIRYEGSAVEPPVTHLDFSHTQQVAIQRGQHLDPAFMPTANRVPVLNNEKAGASYRVRADISTPVDPTVGPTSAQGRILPSSLKRVSDAGAFWSQ